MNSKSPGADRRCTAFPPPDPSCVELGMPDVAVLRKLADALRGKEEEIAAHWERRYRLAFREAGYHSPEDFRAEARRELAAILDHLRRGDCRGLGAWFSAHGRELFERGVPYSEVCRSLRLFQEGVVEFLRAEGEAAEDLLDLSFALDRLSHERLILIAEAYHQTCQRRWERRTRALLTEVARREHRPGGRDRLGGLVGKSPVMQEIYELLILASRNRETVLLVGETGTGKDLAARAIHALAGDPPERFIGVNCAALSHDLIESELFGHRRGAFSGAQADHPGLFRAAQGGTIYLDEFTELPPPAQAKLLRVLQERAIRPVGGLREVAVSTRVVASTNRDLDLVLRDGGLRRDLYYRLRQLVIRFPPLRDRREDIPLLVDRFAERAASEGLCTGAPRFTEEALARLAAHPWPGNVRELESVVRLACRTARGGAVDVADLRLYGPGAGEPGPGPGEGEGAPRREEPAGRPVSIREAERDAIARALEATGGNKTRAARLLGISRKQLYVKIRAYGLPG